MSCPEKFENVTAMSKANVYFDGKVVSYAIIFPDGERKTLGLMYPGEYTFNTGAPERMDLIAGECRVKIADSTEWVSYGAGSYFDVPGQSAFTIAIETGLLEYVCSFK